MKLFTKHPNLRFLLLALIAAGLLAFALYLKSVQSKTSFYDVFLPKKKITVTLSPTPTPSATPSPSPTPHPTPSPGAEGKPQSESNTKPVSASLSVNITGTDGMVTAVTNKIISGNCTFVFTKGSESITQMAALQRITDYSGCQTSTEALSPGTWGVRVSVSDGSGEASDTDTVQK